MHLLAAVLVGGQERSMVLIDQNGKKALALEAQVQETGPTEERENQAVVLRTDLKAFKRRVGRDALRRAVLVADGTSALGVVRASRLG